MADLGWPELSIIVIAFVLLFGWKRMPDMARSLGRSARIFKSEVDEMRHDTAAGPLLEPTDRPTGAPAGEHSSDAAPRSWAEADARATAAEAEAARLRAEAGSGAGRPDAA